MSAYEGWAVVEIMGHIKLAGQVREVSMYGAAMLEVTEPEEFREQNGKIYRRDGKVSYRSGPSLFAVTPCTEEEARLVTRSKIAIPWEDQMRALPAIIPAIDDPGIVAAADEDDNETNYGESNDEEGPAF
jgi:hypothetical protein